MPETRFGGWTDFTFTIPAEAQEVFDKAMEGFVGVSYTPLAVATQVVNGLNYCFLCKGQIVYPHGPEIAAKVYIHQTTGGDLHISEIVRIDP